MGTSSPLSSSTVRELNFELLIMRVACSLPFIYHGAAILFGAFGGPGPHYFAAFMKMPLAVGYLVGLAQFAGGIAILLGALLRVGAVCVIIVMCRRRHHGSLPPRLRPQPRRHGVRPYRAAPLPRPPLRWPRQILFGRHPPRPAAKVVVLNCFQIGGKTLTRLF